jgi:LysR family transcriptional regulator, benzoate and cis,cis-muconate-responsive activator of ben and cat genes
MALELRHLRSFVAVADELHFGRAAARLGIGQPVVSRHVKALEAELGVTLLVRTARETTLTDAGAAALEHARVAVESAARVVSAAHAVANGAAGGTVRVAFTSTTVGVHLPRLMSAMAAAHPAVAVVPTQLRSSDVLPALRRGSVDVAIARHQPGDPTIHRVLLETEPVVAAVHADDPLAGRERVTREEIAARPYIALDPAVLRGHADVGLEDLRARGIEPARIVHAPSVQGALGLVATGAGVYRLPLPNATEQPGVRYVPVEDSTSVVVLYRRREPPSQAIAAVEAIAVGLGER